MWHKKPGLIFLAVLAGSMVAGARPACADVTVEQQTSFDFAIIKAHGTQTEFTSQDKQRRDSDLHCEGFMSLVCGNSQSGDIIRLDRDVTWTLEPKKKEYRETPFPTAAQRQAAQAEMQATLEKMKQCPATQQRGTPAPDTSKCEMSPPRLDVKQPGTHATLAGHDAQLTQLALTQSCTNKSTGDVCDFVFAMDSWLTQDQIAGLDDRRAFEMAYLKKLGLDASNPAMQQQMRQFLAPYADSLKQLSSKAADFKGYSLKTVVRIAFGGEHCAAAKQSAQQASAGGGNVVGDAGQAAGSAASSSAAGAAGSAAGSAAANAAGSNAGGSVLGSAASAFSSKLVSGLFAKKQPDAAATTAATPPAGAANGLAPGMIQAAQFTTETTSISTGPVAPAQFDIPAGWKLIQPQQGKPSKEFTCPSAGSGAAQNGAPGADANAGSKPPTKTDPNAGL